MSLTSRCIQPLLQGSPGAEMDEETASRLLGEAAYNNDLWGLITILSSTKAVNAVIPGPGEFRNHTALLIACLRKHCDWVSIVIC